MRMQRGGVRDCTYRMESLLSLLLDQGGWGMVPRSPWSSLLLVLAAVGASSLTLAAYSWYRWDRIRRLTIIYGSDLQGELEPCGCIEGMLGGLSRRATFVKRVREEGYPVLLVDSGGAFFRNRTIPDFLRDQLSLKAEAIAGAYGEMWYDAVNVGDADLALGWSKLRELGERTSMALLSANLAGADGEGLLSPYAIRKVGRLKVGIFGLCQGDVEGLSLQARDTTAVARRVVEALRPRVDVILCLTHQGFSRDMDLAPAVEGIDIIIGGQSGNSLHVPRLENGTIILQTGVKGRTIGRFDLVLYNDEDPWQDATESEKYRRLAREYEGVVAKHQAILQSTEDPARRYDSERMFERYTRETEIARGRVKDHFGVNHYFNQVVSLTDSHGDDDAILEIIAAYKGRVRELAAKGATVGVEEVVLYLGAGSCKECHEAEYDSWKTTQHAQGYASLEKTDREIDLECVGCHTTGYRKEGGFEAPSAVGRLKGVQCEACHGAGAGHPEEKGKLPLRASEEVCVNCHTAEYSPDFDFASFWGRIAHTEVGDGPGRSTHR